MARKALILSCGAYAPQLMNLSSAIPDAERLAALLAKRSIGDFEVTKVLNPSLLKAQIAINEFLSSASVKDLNIVYISGHGVKDLYGRFYVALPETNLLQLPATSLSGRFLREQLADTASRLLLVILDTCFAGAFGRDMIAKSVSPAAGLPDELIEEPRGHVIMAATSAIQFAFETIGDSPASLFTKTLCDGIETGAADLDGDGWISINDLFTYTREKMREDSKAQTPEMSYLGVNASVRIARTPRTLAPNGQDNDVNIAAKSTHPELRLAAARVLGQLVRDANRQRSSMARANLRSLKNDEDEDIRRIVSAALGRSYRIRQPTVHFRSGTAQTLGTMWASLQGRSLQLAGEQTPTFASFGDDLPVLAEVALYYSDSGLQVYSTDRYRFDWRLLSVLAGGETSFFALVSADDFAVLRDLPADAVVRIDVHEKEIYFTAGDSVLRVRRGLFQEFPTIDSIIGSVTPTCSASRLAVIEGVESLVCDRRMQLDTPITMTPSLEDSVLIISAETKLKEQAPRTSIKADGLQRGKAFRLDYQRLLEGLDSFLEDTVYFDLSRTSGPMVILNAGDNATHRHAIMPMQAS